MTTVLIVDDLEQNIKLLKAKLLAEYYNVFTASSGKQALELLQNNQIDIVLLDVMMPGMDGFQTCRHIKNNTTTTHIPVVMVTALTDIESRVQGLEVGADEFLAKPINDTALFARIKSLTRMKAVLDELKQRNKTSAAIGSTLIKTEDLFSESKILILDDDAVQVKNIKFQLNSLTDRIVVFNDLSEIESLGAFVPNVIIISCQIDFEDPLRVVVRLKADQRYKDSVLMLLVEEENMNMVIKAMEIGVNDYFLYPVDKSELQARVKTQLRRQQYQSNLRTSLEESFDLSIKDGLTNVFNRRYFDIHIQQLINNASEYKLSLLMLDIDNFKLINDTYGHPVGDIVLRKLASILKSSVRVVDLIARYGGEEFVILLKNVNLTRGKKIAEKVRKLVEDAVFDIKNSNSLKITVSIGVGEYNQNESIEHFIQRVDQSMYSAKRSGRNNIIG